MDQSMTAETVRNLWRLPDQERCRTKHLEHSLNFSDCLVKNPYRCEYAVRLRSGVYCRNPDRRRFETIPAVAEHMNPQAGPASETARPLGQNLSRSIEKWWLAPDRMSRETRQKLSASAKKRWAIRGGMSSETRQKISTSVKKWWDERRRVGM
jgi:hypothetical protein